MLDALIEEVSTPFGSASVAVIAARLLVAILLAGVIGMEREWRDKPAGLRTHMLVAVAACLFVLVGQQLSYVPINEDADLQVDPLRLIEAVTAGVAFMAAGVIFTSRGQVRNLKTGASMWMAGAVGVACGAGQMPLAALATVVVVCVMVAVRRIEKWMGTY
ncbi:MgtC/SapB family protein [Jannaschia sp. Os4]|uniref:MgtC/SapB family protein n=1 Tax=Jannaschia sp. Os4 TaxID=2807617 RepID=UPI00193A0A5F|nr:MgtC/SapB family protein [Jannaschia sp. Os4]MBM2574809.1 MgtC/SapB family protein [Jannaschia sp. Os4]